VRAPLELTLDRLNLQRRWGGKLVLELFGLAPAIRDRPVRAPLHQSEVLVALHASVSIRVHEGQLAVAVNVSRVSEPPEESSEEDVCRPGHKSIRAVDLLH
jgi:hypothetical protein